MTGLRCNGFRRVQKMRARKIYNGGGMIYICPYKMRPGGPWSPEIAVTKTDMDAVDGASYFVANTRDFDVLVREFEHFNCSSSVGEYAAFYIKD